EQFVLTNCPKLYRFHRRWLTDLLDGREEGEP
ncbi:MAG: hypothetical protein JWO31_3852, partial [Phycisphaerales bacterium]|nr:hypothetical protein [Phycisphaerales bacterium]